MHITRDRENHLITVNQKAYLEKILENAGMSQCNPVSTPMTPGVALQKATRAPTQEEAVTIASIPYRRTISELNYAMRTTRPDIAYTVTTRRVSLYQRTRRAKHIRMHYHLIRDLVDTKKIDLRYKQTSEMRRQPHQSAPSSCGCTSSVGDGASTGEYVERFDEWECQDRRVIRPKHPTQYTG